MLAVLSLIVMTGCASVGISTKPPGRHEIGNSYSIATSKSWSHISGPPETWTIDGMALGVMQTWADLHDGDTLFEKSDQSIPEFRSSFTALEVAEMVADTIENLVPGADVETTEFRPMPFGSVDGFRFEFSYLQDGLPYKGMAAGAIRGDRLDLILYRAPAEHFFDLYSPEIESIIESVRTTA